jgi:2'-5' RNA ligase
MPAETHRLFFALWPDERTREEMVRRRELLGRISRRPVPDHNLHLTLAFLGDRPATEVEAIRAAAGGIEGGACRLVLDRFGWFPGARVLWLGGDAPPALGALHDELHERMRHLGLALDTRPFRPHVTLFRKVARRPALPEPPPLEWPVRDFALVESIPGRPYELLDRWPLVSGR